MKAFLGYRSALLAVFILTGPVFSNQAKACELSTVSEKSGWKLTGRYSEVQDLVSCFEKRYPGRAKMIRFGKTPEGRPMLALAVGAGSSELKPGGSNPVVFFQGGIHAGEIDGKDAGFLFVREVLEGKVLKGALSKLTLLFVPVFNIDGHERFGPHNRPNQVGPAEMGWRTTAQNYNLNRDYMKADAPEMRAMLKLTREWDPILSVDLHVTDGADFQLEVSTMVEPSLRGPTELSAAGRALRDALMVRLKSSGHVSSAIYPSFKEDDLPLSGIEAGVQTPKFSQGYWALRNRLGILVETHSWKDYKTRVLTTHDTLVGIVAEAKLHALEWKVAALAGEKQMSALAGLDVPLTYKVTDKSHEVEFPGYAFKRVMSPVSGREETIYDPAHKETWKIPLYDELVPKFTVKAPMQGYLVPAAWAKKVAAKLDVHGVKYRVLSQEIPQLEVQAYRARELTWGKKSFEGNIPLGLKGDWKLEKREIPKGSLFVPIDQKLARIALNLLEPEGNESLAAWGQFNTAFERKEYMEPYVADLVGREMLQNNPEVKARFEAKLKSDPEFAKDPEKRLDFFYELHPSYDERYMLYPVYRLEDTSITRFLRST